MGAVVGGVYGLGKLDEFEEWVRAIRRIDTWIRFDTVTGEVLLIETDTTADGVRDTKRINDANGVTERLEGDRNADGKPDYWVIFAGGVPASYEEDKDFEGRPDGSGQLGEDGSVNVAERDSDEDGKLDSRVTFESGVQVLEERDAGVAPVVFQTNLTATSNTAGHNHGGGCSDPTGSGVTGWFCCIGAGKHDATEEIPGKRSCPMGEYTYDVLSVVSPEGTPIVWDGEIPGPLSVDFEY